MPGLELNSNGDYARGSSIMIIPTIEEIIKQFRLIKEAEVLEERKYKLEDQIKEIDNELQTR